MTLGYIAQDPSGGQSPSAILLAEASTSDLLLDGENMYTKSLGSSSVVEIMN